MDQATADVSATAPVPRPESATSTCRAAGGRPGPAGAPAIVVFADHAECRWLRPLRRGFRHCFVVLHQAPVWLACEPLKDRIELTVLNLPAGFDLARFYVQQGHRVLVGPHPAPGPRRSAAPAPLTCVSVVKRLLTIRAPWVWTPWQLYTHLLRPTGGFRPWHEAAGAVEHSIGGWPSSDKSRLDMLQ